MKLRAPYDNEPQFITVIEDCDADGVEIDYFDSQEDAEKSLDEKYEGVPSDSEPGAVSYAPGETPNTAVEVIKVLVCRVLKRTIM